MNESLWERVSAEQLPPLCRGARVIAVPSGLRSKEKLLGVFATKLRFPRYFGWNWDAFEECLNDLSWLPDDLPIVVVHRDLPFGAGENRATYCEVLEAWQERTTAKAKRSVTLMLVN